MEKDAQYIPTEDEYVAMRREEPLGAIVERPDITRRTVGPLLDELETTLGQLLEAGSFTPATGSNVNRLQAIVDALGKPTPPPQEVQDDEDGPPDWDWQPKRNRATAKISAHMNAVRAALADDGADAFDFERDLRVNNSRQIGENRSHICQLASAVSILLHVVASKLGKPEDAFELGQQAHEIQQIHRGGDPQIMARRIY